MWGYCSSGWEEKRKNDQRMKLELKRKNESAAEPEHKFGVD